MIPIEVIGAFAASALLLSLSPGPSNLYILACTMGAGARGGVAAAGGMAIGSVLYVLATALGLAAIIAYLPWLFVAIKVGGAAYLLYLGVQAIRQARLPHLRKPVQKSPSDIVKQSVIVELTNPKTALFFIAFLPQFTHPDWGNPATQLVTLGVLYSIIALCSDLLVVSLSHQLGRWMKRSPKWAIRQERFAGGILIGLGGIILAETVK